MRVVRYTRVFGGKFVTMAGAWQLQKKGRPVPNESHFLVASVSAHMKWGYRRTNTILQPGEKVCELNQSPHSGQSSSFTGSTGVSLHHYGGCSECVGVENYI